MQAPPTGPTSGNKPLWAFVAVAVFAFCCPSCASLGGRVRGSQSDLSYPPWVIDGTRLRDGSQTKALFGLGEVRGIRNVALARSTADNRARAELARLLEAFVAKWVKPCANEAEEWRFQQQVAPLDDSATKSAFAGTTSAKSLNQEDVIKLLVASNLSAVQIVEHHFHSHDGAVFSLARLDLSHMVQHLQASHELNAPLKSCLTGASELVYATMAQAQRPPVASSAARSCPHHQ